MKNEQNSSLMIRWKAEGKIDLSKWLKGALDISISDNCAINVEIDKKAFIEDLVEDILVQVEYSKARIEFYDLDKEFDAYKAGLRELAVISRKEQTKLLNKQASIHRKEADRLQKEAELLNKKAEKLQRKAGNSFKNK